MTCLQPQHLSNCAQCELAKVRRNIVSPVLPLTTEILIVSEYPSKEEDIEGVHIAQKSNQVHPLRNILISAGFDENDPRVGFTFVNRCRPNEIQEAKRAAGKLTRPVRPKEVATCMEYLKAEVRQLPNLKVVIALGANAGKAVMEQNALKVALLHGVVLSHPVFKTVLVTSNPNRLLYCRTAEETIQIKTEIVDTFRKAFLLRTETQHELERISRHMYIARTRKQLEWAFSELNNPENKVIAFDFETTSLDYLEAEVLCISVSWKEHTGVTIPMVGYRRAQIWAPEDLSYLWGETKKFLESETIRKIAHNGKYDIQVARTHGINVRNFMCDTMIMHYLLDENSSHALETLSYTFTDYGGYDAPLYDMRKQVAAELNIKLEDVTYDLLPVEMLWEYAAGDACMTFELYHIFKPRIIEERLTNLLFNHFIPLVRVFADVEYDGVQIDFEHLQKTISEYRQKIDQARADILQDPQVVLYENRKREELHQARLQKWMSSKTLQKRYSEQEYITAKDDTVVFNPGSSKQLKELFIDQLKLKVLAETGAKNPKIDAKVLQQYAKRVAVARLMAKANKLSTLYTTFMIGVRDNIRKDGRLHQSINLHVAKTGRLSSSGPNLQNTPNKANNPADYVAVRNSFVADPGCVLIDVDYSQAEFRMWGQLSGDKVLIQDLLDGIDIHKKVAALGFGISEAEVSSDLRTAAKAVVFGTMYGRSARSVAMQLGITIKEAEKLQAVLFDRYKTAAAWIRRVKALAETQGYVEGFFGQRRHLQDAVHHPDKEIKAKAQRQAVNSPIQGSASQMNCFAVLNITKAFKQHGVEGRVIMLIHDSIIINVKKQQLQLAQQLIIQAMVHPHPTVTVPLKIEMKIGERWGEVEPIEV